MSMSSGSSLEKIECYLTAEYCCSYLPQQSAQSLITAPPHVITAHQYSSLIKQGFRRSGKFVYKPHCQTCRECIPVRIVLADFAPNRSQQRAYKKHQNLTTTILPIGFHDAHYALYRAYQKARHADVHDSLSGENSAHTEERSLQDDIEQYKNFLCQSSVESVLVEFRDQGQLKMLSVIDIVNDGISAVYTFYDTRDKNVSYGTYNVMWQATWAQSLHFRYLYLGYFIKESKKMAYKQNYKPLEMLIDVAWQQGSIPIKNIS